MTQKIDINKKYKTESGLEVVLYTTEGRSHSYPVIGEIIFADGSVQLCLWADNGQKQGVFTTSFNLVEVKPRIKRTVWINVYADHESVYSYNTKAEADRYASALDRKSCVKIEIDCEEGDGL
jgi:hypothetical protein